MIVDNGWITKLTLHNVTRIVTPLATTPTRQLANGIPIETTKSDTALANSLYECSNMGQFTNYYHACLNYPVKFTLIKAIDRGNLKEWWGFTSQQTRRHISISTESEMGHMDQNCQVVQSTQPGPPNPPTKPVCVPDIVDDPIEDVPQEPHNPCTHFVFTTIYDINGNLFTDQTVRFPISSNHGHAYVVVFYIFNANSSCSVPIKNCSKEELLHAYCKIYTQLTLCGFNPLLHKLNNKTFKDIETFVTTKQTCIQYTQPDIHHTNPTERAICTWKIILLPAWRAFPNCFRLPTGAKSQLNAMPLLTCSVRIVKILYSWHTRCSKVCSPLMLYSWHPLAQMF
jgi:hypothetical protein